MKLTDDMWLMRDFTFDYPAALKGYDERVFVYRRDEWCSCNRFKTFQCCIHTLVCKNNDGSKLPCAYSSDYEGPVFTVQNLKSLKVWAYLKREGDSFEHAIIKSTDKWTHGYKCVTCQPESCHHVEAVIKSQARCTEVPDASPGDDQPEKKQQKAISTHPINYLPTPEDVVRTKKLNLNFPSCLVPPYSTTKCEHSNEYFSGDPIETEYHYGKDCILYTQGDYKLVTVYYRPTVGDCECRLLYDGWEHNVINVNNKCLISHHLIQEYLYALQFNQQTLFAFTQTKAGVEFNKHRTVPSFSEVHFRVAVLSYCENLRFPTRAFTCVECEAMEYLYTFSSRWYSNRMQY